MHKKHGLHSPTRARARASTTTLMAVGFAVGSAVPGSLLKGIILQRAGGRGFNNHLLHK